MYIFRSGNGLINLVLVPVFEMDSSNVSTAFKFMPEN